MLVEEPNQPSSPALSRRRRSPAIVLLLALVAVIVIALRHDYWNWDTPYPLLFGFLPVGLWWQGLVSLLAALMMALMVRFAWPQHLEDDALAAEQKRSDA